MFAFSSKSVGDEARNRQIEGEEKAIER